MTQRKFARCESCGNIVGIIHEAGGKLVCCGKPMTVLEANTSDGATEKHVPKVTRDGNKVSVVVGDVLHPSTPEHSIQWIALAQGPRMQRVSLKDGDEPKADFCVCDKSSEPIVVFEYCNLHGLWKAEL